MSWDGLQAIIPAYLYAQYSDDANLQAYIQAYNELATGYLDWFVQTPIAVWTNPNVTGLLLDWIGQNLYGFPRPVQATLTETHKGGIATQPLSSFQIAGYSRTLSGTGQAVNDDLYKRSLTWVLYLGDGRNATIPWLRNRVRRFLYGVNGSDTGVGEPISLSTNSQFGVGAVATFVVSTKPVVSLTVQNASQIVVSIAFPNTDSGNLLEYLLGKGLLPTPRFMTIRAV